MQQPAPQGRTKSTETLQEKVEGKEGLGESEIATFLAEDFYAVILPTAELFKSPVMTGSPIVSH